MAEAFITAAQDELSCPICLELFVEPNIPKDLPGCDHVICEVCLKKMVNALTERKRAFNCPECRKDINLPKGGVDALRTNRKIRNLAEKHPKDVKEDDSPCNGIESEGPQTRHLSQKEELEITLTATQAKIKRFKQTIHDFKELKEQVRQSHSREEEIVDQSAEVQICKIREKAQVLKTQLRNAEREKQRRVDDEIIGLEQKVEKAETDYEAASNALVNSTENDCSFANYTSLMERIKNISIQTPIITNHSFSGHAAAVFRQEPNENEIKLGTLVYEVCARTPEVRTSLNTPEVVTARKEAVTLKLMQTLDGQSTRITWSPNEWLVFSESSKRHITLCQQKRGMYKQKKSWKVDCNFQPGGVAISADGTLIFVALWADVWIYSPTGKLLRKFKGTQNGVYSVKITANDRILVGYFHGNVITEHNYRGDVLRTINTNIKPYYISLMQDTHIIISDFESGRVCVIQSAIGMHSGQKNLTINIPDIRGICYDEQTGSLLAITKNGTCVDQFDCTTGMFIARVLEGLTSAWDLALSSDKILAVSTGKCINIYQVV